MSKINDGGPAFPFTHFDLSEGEQGMTLRDWFAGQALPFVAGDLPSCANFHEQAAIMSYRMADAMIKARGAT